MEAGKTVDLTANEVRVLTMLLRLDLDAIGFEPKDQKTLRAVLRKLGE